MVAYGEFDAITNIIVGVVLLPFFQESQLE
jgi:hypothetical protein